MCVSLWVWDCVTYILCLSLQDLRPGFQLCDDQQPGGGQRAGLQLRQALPHLRAHRQRGGEITGSVHLYSSELYTCTVQNYIKPNTVDTYCVNKTIHFDTMHKGKQ